jgi:hypothetical protein
VTDRENGDPAVGMVVVAGLVKTDTPAMMNFVKPDAPRAGVGTDGSYKLQGLPPGEYRVVPRTGDSEYASMLSRNGRQVVLEDGLDVEAVDFRVSRGGRVFGWVTDENEEPVSGARCTLMPTEFLAEWMKGDGEMMMLLGERTIKTDAKGYFERQGIPLEKAFAVSAIAEGYAPSTGETIELSEANPTAEIMLTLDRGFSISGHVYHENGQPAVDVRVATSIDVGKILSGGFNPGLARPTTD